MERFIVVRLVYDENIKSSKSIQIILKRKHVKCQTRKDMEKIKIWGNREKNLFGK